MTRVRFLAITIVAIVSFLGSPSAAHAAITATDNVNPLPPWDSDETVYIGETSNGSLTIDGGDDLQSRYTYIGYNAGVTGEVAVTGAGSTWKNNEGPYYGYSFYVGYRGTGSLTITDRGSVSTSDNYIGGQSGSTGKVIVRGAGSTWTSSLYSHVGLYGIGTLDITDGATVNNNHSYIGTCVGSTGVVTVTGAGSTWTNSGSLYVGDLGSGTLVITDGGKVDVAKGTYIGFGGLSSGSSIAFGSSGETLSTASLYFASPSQLMGTGTISTRGLVSDMDLTFDSVASLIQTFRFNMQPNQDVTLKLDIGGSAKADALGAGYESRGTTTIRNGMTVQSRYGAIGHKPGSIGTVTVAGAGSRWTNDTIIGVGYLGNGTLVIAGGGAVNSSDISIAYGPGATGEVTVSGAKSMCTSTGTLCVGEIGDGAIAVMAGGTVESKDAYIGHDSGSTGKATVSGAGSTWTNSRNLYVGYCSYVGYYGSGSLAITYGGLVHVGGRLSIDDQGDGPNSVDMATGGMLALAGDADGSLQEFMALVDGSDAIRYWKDSISDWAPLTLAIPGVDYTLVYVDDRVNDLYGCTVLTVGTIPEPTAVLMLVTGVIVLLVRRRRGAGWQPTPR
jgi:fibronectin-binding autotransporter adhesin